jgi:hypothetical protein
MIEEVREATQAPHLLILQMASAGGLLGTGLRPARGPHPGIPSVAVHNAGSREDQT